MLYTRRDALKLGLVGTAAAAFLPAGCAGYHAHVAAGDSQKLKFLSVKDYAILLHVADALLPAGNGYPSHRELGTVLQLDDELSKWEPVRNNEIPVLLRLVEHGTQLFGYSFHRFTRLSPDRQREYLLGWGESSLNAKRGGFVALKGLLGFYYFSNPAVWPLLGYDGPWQGRFDIPITEIEGLPA